MASTGRAAPSSPGPRHSSPPRPPSFPPSDKTGFQHGAEGASGSWAAPAALGTRAASSPVPLCVWALRPRFPLLPRAFLPLCRERSVWGGGLGASRLLLQSKGHFGRDSALRAAGGGVQLGRRAVPEGPGLPLCLLPANSESGSIFPGKLPIVPRLCAGYECVCDSPVPSGEQGVPVTHRFSARGCRGNALQL